MPGRHVLRPRDRGDDPPPAADQMGDSRLGALPVVDVDVARLDVLRRPPDEHDRHPGRAETRGQGIVLVEADQERAVDVPGGQVVGGPGFVRDGLGHQQDELPVARCELGADAAQQAREERVTEQPAGRLGDDHCDRIAAAGDQAAGGPVGDVAEAIDGCLDVDADVRADSRRSVHDARDGRPGDARHVGDLLEGRVAASVAAAGLGHGPLRSAVRALSRLCSTVARRVKRALSRSIGVFSGAARVARRSREGPTERRLRQPRARRRYAKLP